MKVGDRVIIREDAKNFSNRVGWDDGMDKYCGREVTVYQLLTNNRFHIEEDDGYYYWDFDMVDDEPPKEIKVPEEKEHTMYKKINKKELMNEGFNILNFCDIYNPTEDGMETIWEEYINAKGNTPVWGGMSLIDILSKDPDYVPEKGYIVKRNSYTRGIIWDVVEDVLYRIKENVDLCYDEVVLKSHPYKEVRNSIERLDNLAYHMKCMKEMGHIVFDNIYGSLDNVVNERKKYSDLFNQYYDGYFIHNDKAVTTESKNFARKLKTIIDNLINYTGRCKINEDAKDFVINDEIANMLTEFGVKGIRSGQKFNKVVQKLLKFVSLDTKWTNENGYTKQMARLGDACNPTEFIRFTIFSVNWIDYWTMSWGKDWCSCANIDKEHNRYSSRVGMYGDGCCSSGTESYMLDPSTIVVYTVDAEYNGKDFELQDKINRCLFHLGEGKFIMGRVYPQGTDGEAEVYKQWRAMFQKVIADCMEVPNFWTTTGENKSRQYISCGTHYEDYAMDYCNIAKWSYNKPTTETEPSPIKIKIGHDPICPCCGKEHDQPENIQCYDCSGERFYCAYHDRYEYGEYETVSGYGDVCYDALECSEDFARCNRCDDWIYVEDDDVVCTEDGNYYCGGSCANSDGYYYLERYEGWYYEDEFYYCEECGRDVLECDWNDELEMCNECAENRESEEE